MTGRPATAPIAGAVVLALAVLAIGPVATAPVAAQETSVTVTNATVTTSSPAAGETFVVRATIRNSERANGSFDLTNVYVQGPDGRSTVARDLGQLAPGSATTIEIPVSVSESGWHSLSVRVHGISPSDSVKTLRHPIPVQIGDEEASQLSMAATADDLGPSGQTDLRVTVANGFERAVTGVNLRVESDGMTLPESQRVASRLVAGNQTTFTFPVRDVDPGQYTVRATMQYSIDGGDRRTVERELSTVVSPVEEPGRIGLSGIDVEPEDDVLAVRGTAANSGTTDVTSVNVSVVDGETAGPADSSASHFVGDVPASDFSSFTVQAEADDNETDTITIPIRVSYIVDGERTSHLEAVTHELDSETGPEENPAGGNGSRVGTYAIIGAVVLIGIILLGWRRYRG